MPQNKDAKKQQQQQRSHPKNNQRGSQSLSSLNNIAETKTSSANSGAKPRNENFQRGGRAPPRAHPRTTQSEYSRATPGAPHRSNQSAPFRPTPGAPPRSNQSAPFRPTPRSHPKDTQWAPSRPSNAPPSYEESAHQQFPFSNPPPLLYNSPPLLNNPPGRQGYQNYQIPGAGYSAPYRSQTPMHANYHHPRRPFHPQNTSRFNAPLQHTFPVRPTGHNFAKNSQPTKAEAPKPTPRTSIQNKSENTTSASDSKPQNQNKDVKVNVDINVIVRKLSDCDGYFSFLKDLSQKLEINSSDLLKIVKEKDHIFSTIYDREKKDSLVELCPKIELCRDHQENGCILKDCSKIHMCEDFIFSNCSRNDCPLGHTSTFKSNHNIDILKTYYMSILPNTTLEQLFQKVCKRNLSMKICFDYHQEKCKFGDNCKDIHICYSYVNNLGLCSNENCMFNHNIRDPKITAIFASLKISTNESPRDLLKILRNKCLENEKEISSTKELSETMSVSDGKQESLDKDPKKDKRKRTKADKKSAGDDKQNEKSTKHCTNFHGSVKIAKVCMSGMKLNCKYIQTGCNYLHCRHKSHWQFGNDDKWFNFHLYHSQILDSKYSDPNCEDVDLPKLDFTRLNPSQRNLITVLGKKSLTVDFKKMTLLCESTGITYSLRNLTTDSSALANDDNDLDNYTVFKWYFRDDDEQYKLFDKNEDSSAIIEKDYVKTPNGITKFRSINFSYSIDFSKMTQENDTSHKVRSLKRRPFISRNEKKDKNEKDTEEKISLPKNWDVMKNESFKRVKLNHNDEEYNDIRQILCLTMPQINIINIWRIQNIFLWQKFKNKRGALEKQYKDNFLNVQKLFHGIDSESVDDIIRENFEFRRHSITSSRPYGEGTYFYNSASAGAINCSPDVFGKKILLIAEVLIGKVAQGSPGITRPPENPAYNSMYDSTTDDVLNPSVYVKYSTLEYYPAYIVEFI